MRRFLGSIGLVALAAIALTTAGADPPTFTTGPLVPVSGTSPFASCTEDNVAGQPGTNFLNSEVEPWVDVNPTDPRHIVEGWQADRWSNGGARGFVAGVSFNGGTTWTQIVIPGITVCSGGTAVNGGDFK